MTFFHTILSLTLLLWGYRTGFILIAIPLALLFGFRPFQKKTFRPGSRFYEILWDYSLFALILTLAYTFLELETLSSISQLFSARSITEINQAIQKSSAFLFQALQVIPILLGPFSLAVAASPTPILPAKTFSWILRRQYQQSENHAAPDPMPLAPINPLPAYWALTLLAGSTAPDHHLTFFILVLLLLAAMLWHHRPAAYSSLQWVFCWVLSLSLSCLGLILVRETHQWMEDLRNTVANHWPPSSFTSNPETSSHLGHIGALKQSSKITFRIQKNNASTRLPHLLRTQVYQAYRGNTWYNLDRIFSPTFPISHTPPTWTLQNLTNSSSPTNLLLLTPSSPQTLSHIPLPIGATLLLPSSSILLETNALGILRPPTPLPASTTFYFAHQPNTDWASAPSSEDLSLPEEEQSTLDTILQECQIQSVPYPEAIRRLRSFFQNHFEYSTQSTLTPAQLRQKSSILSHFLLKSRSGHCEYFATATTLLLRSIGLPARYTVGYAVQEPWGQDPNLFVVRQRHAHAWASVYLNGSWIDVDTTPSHWFETESNTLSSFSQSVMDRLSHAWFLWNEWRHQTNLHWLLLGLPPLTLMLGILLRRRSQRQKAASRPSSSSITRPTLLGIDSDLFQIEKLLQARGLHRPSHVPLGLWLKSVPKMSPNLQEALQLHSQYRFDPQGIAPSQRERLAQLTTEILKHLSSPPQTTSTPSKTNRRA